MRKYLFILAFVSCLLTSCSIPNRVIIEDAGVYTTPVYVNYHYRPHYYSAPPRVYVVPRRPVVKPTPPPPPRRQTPPRKSNPPRRR